MPAIILSMLAMILSAFKFAGRAALLFLATTILTIILAETIIWVYSDNASAITFLQTFQCNPYADNSTECTLGYGSNQFKLITIDTLYDLFFKLVRRAWNLKLLFKTRDLLREPDVEHDTVVHKWVLGWTGDDEESLILIVPQFSKPDRSTVLIWFGSFILASSIVIAVTRIWSRNKGQGQGQLVRRMEAETVSIVDAHAGGNDDGDDSEYEH